MSTLREAAQAALDALDDAAGNINPERGYCDELETHITLARDALRAALAEPQGEPVGHVRIDSGEVHFVPRQRDADVAGFVDGQLLYTAPPAQKREPLTDDQINALPCTDGSGSDWDALVRFARAVERAHGIDL